MIGLGQMKRNAGDLAAAEQYFQRAIEVQPCLCAPYVELARLSHQQMELPGLTEALMELALALGALDEEDVLGGCDIDSTVPGAEILQELSKETGFTPGQLTAMSIGASRGDEPAAVTGRPEQLRFQERIQPGAVARVLRLAQ
jgi:hypothetical protein